MNQRTRRYRKPLLWLALLLPLAFSTIAEAQSAGIEEPLVCQYRPVRHEVVDGVDISVIERATPLPDAAEHGVVVWIDDGEHRVWKIELHDRDGRLLFTVRYLSYEREHGEWRPVAIYVLDQRKGEARVVRELDKVAGVRLDEVRAGAVGCVSLN